jgi:hypothetical protein
VLPAEPGVEMLAAPAEATNEIDGGPTQRPAKAEAVAEEAAPEIEAAPPDSTVSHEELAAHEPALQVIAALEQWLDAIHVTRADRSA